MSSNPTIQELRAIAEKKLHTLQQLITNKRDKLIEEMIECFAPHINEKDYNKESTLTSEEKAQLLVLVSNFRVVDQQYDEMNKMNMMD
jgi:hypothetical protein